MNKINRLVQTSWVAMGNRLENNEYSVSVHSYTIFLTSVGDKYPATAFFRVQLDIAYICYKVDAILLCHFPQIAFKRDC